MSTYAIEIRDEEGTRGQYFTPDEVAAALEEYRATHVDDPEFTRVVVWEMSRHGSVGTERSAWDFVDER